VSVLEQVWRGLIDQTVRTLLLRHTAILYRGTMQGQIIENKFSDDRFLVDI
jgi:hypothetical protein